jgi:hypothetical protein
MSFLAEPIKAFASWIEHPFKKRVVMFSEGSAHDVETLSIKVLYTVCAVSCWCVVSHIKPVSVGCESL